jgi:serine protease Do
VACKGFDEQVVRLDKGLSELAKQFVLVRITNMRGVDLSRFEFDYDLTWAGLFMNAEGHTYGRFGGRGTGDPEEHLTVPALKYAMQRALTAYRRDPEATPRDRPKEAAEDYAAARELKPNACIHCHQVYDFRRDALRKSGRWENAMAHVYPPPQTIGFEMELDRPDVVKRVSSGSAAALAGLAMGDRVESVGQLPVASFLDMLTALESAPQSGTLGVRVRRGGSTRNLRIALAPGWRKYDMSWRASMWDLQPSASVYGEDLKPREKQTLGLAPDAVAFRQGDYVPPAAARAGIRARDIVLGVVGEENATRGMNMLQFNVHVRMTYKPGDRVVYGIIRDGRRMELPVVLPAKD